MSFVRATATAGSIARRTWIQPAFLRPYSASSSTPPPPPPPNSNANSNPAPGTTNLPTLDFAPAEAEPQRTGARSAKGSMSSIERKQRNAFRVGFGMFLVGLASGGIYLARDWEKDELSDKNKDPQAGAIDRARARAGDVVDIFSKPAWSELLPPPLPEQYQKPLTLLLSLDDLLVSSTWDRQNGWRTAKRPGVDYFLGYLSQFYEIVIFTTQPHYSAIPITDKLDPYNYFISYQLFREATRSEGGKIIKDISYLNRDLGKVIAIDTVDEHYQGHADNAIILPKWKGDPRDRGLVGLIPFLESVAIHNAQDVRPIIKAYHGRDIAIEYAKQEAEHKRRITEEWEKKRKSGLGRGGGGFFSGVVGGGDQNSDPGKPPLTYLEQKRKLAQQIYKEEQDYLRVHGAAILKAKEEQQMAQLKEMQGSLLGMLTGQPPNKQAADAAAQAEQQKAAATPSPPPTQSSS